MSLLSIAFVLSLFASLVLTRVVRDVADRFGFVDKPDGRRKIHARAIPVGGGIAVLMATVFTLAVLTCGAGPLQAEAQEHASELLGLLLALGVICAVGVLDDMGYLRGRQKLAGQIVAVGIVIYFGVLVEHISILSWDIELGLLAVPFTAFLLLGAINSLNLLDGMDGLLSCIGLIITLALGVMALLGGHWLAASLALALAGALLGFLCYNFPPATIFLGDSGSMVLGLAIGVLAIQSSLKGPATIALAAPLAALAVPILDTTAAILRRKLTGRSLYTTDRGHLHHCLLSRGFSNRRVLFLVSLFCLVTAAGALASLALKNELVAILAALAVAAILIGVRLFGYAEFMLAKQSLVTVTSSFLRLRPRAQAHATEVQLQGSANWKDLWDAFVTSAEDLNLKRFHLDLNAPAIHEGYHGRWECRGSEAEDSTLWFLEIPLLAGGQTVGRVEVAGHRDDEPEWAKIARLSPLITQVEATISALADSRSPRARPVTNANGAPHSVSSFKKGPALPESPSLPALDPA
jgi:UDP-GlcNAc:undecaprenyl-phosphate/decaprenyl-phosphate GlcNAc-1-phosphate transferase